MNEIIPSQLKLIKEQQKFARHEINILRAIRNKKLFYLVTSYTAFIGILIYGYFEAKARWSNYREEEQARFVMLWPFVFGTLFIGLTIYFINYNNKLVKPFVKDINNGMKEVIYFKPEIYKTPFFSDYFIVTPVKNRQRIRINAEMCNSIQTTGVASVSVAPYSGFVFEIDVGKSEITFNETNEPVDT